MRKVTVRLGPLVRNHDANIGKGGRDAREIKLADDLRKLLKLLGERFVLPVPSGHSPAGFLGGAQIRHFTELLRGGIGVTPQIDANTPRTQSRVHLRAIVGRDSLWRELCGRGTHFVNHHRTARALGERDFESRTVGSTR